LHVQTTATAATTLIAPYGGRLVDLLVPEEERAEARAYASTLPSLQMSPRVVCDLELLASGGFSPLDSWVMPIFGACSPRCGSPMARSFRSQ
jgi:sulfate adenylyltransferase